jgi:hypothetical protein
VVIFATFKMEESGARSAKQEEIGARVFLEGLWINGKLGDTLGLRSSYINF